MISIASYLCLSIVRIIDAANVSLKIEKQSNCIEAHETRTPLETNGSGLVAGMERF